MRKTVEQIFWEKGYEMKVKKSSVRLDIISFFSVLMVFTLIIVGFVVFSSWKASSDEMVGKLEKDAHEDILSKMEANLSVPLHINQMSHYSLENKIVDIYDERERAIFFAGIIKSTPSNVYSFSYGTEKGEYYGARRNPEGDIEIMRSDEKTLGNSTYYETNPDMTAGKVVEQLGKFDPRTRDWYKIAKEKGEPVFSPTYTHFVMNDLAISAAYPIYDEDGVLQGVLGTHFILSNINAFLKEIVEPKNASAFIFEKKTGEVIASTRNMPKFMAYPDKPLERVTIDQMENDLFSKAYKEYLVTSQKDFIVDAEDDSHRVNIVEYQKNGLDWIVITAIPHGQFMAPIMRGFWFSLIFFLGALMVSLGLLVKSSSIFLRPIDHLVETAARYAEGDFTQRAQVFKNDEIGKLSQAFNSMADKFTASLDLSEAKLKTRTTEMEKVNTELAEAAARIRNTLNSVGSGFISTDRFGDVVMMNTEAEILTGWSQEDAIGMPFQEVFHVLSAATGERCHNVVVRVFEQGEKVEFQCEPILVSRDGDEIPIEGIASPIEDDHGRRGGVVILFVRSREARQIESLHSISS